MTSPNPRLNRRLTWSLAAGFVMLLIVVAGLVGYIVADGSEPPRAVTSPSSTAGVSPVFPLEEPMPTLQSVVDKFFAEVSVNESSPNYLSQFREIMNTYAVPACASVLIGYAEAFAGAEAVDEGPPNPVSVNQTGTTGTSVEHTADGSEDVLHWTFAGGSWKFTCQGLFEETTTETVEPAQTDTEVQEDPAVAGQEAWGDCIAEGNTPAECREIVDGG